MSSPTISTVTTPTNGINWHVETSGSGPHLILVPSGEGDCESFSKLASLLSTTYTVTTFDMPGFSRSTCPISCLENLTASKLAAQIISLLDELHIKEATFYGCSSGALAVLTMAAEHPERVKQSIVHEVPLSAAAAMGAWKAMPDEQVISICQGIFANTLCAKPAAWNALPASYHERLYKDYVTWVRYYVNVVERSFTPAELRRRPVYWTIGGLSPAGIYWQNVTEAAYGAGIQVGVLPSKQFPQVSIPELMAEHVKSCIDEGKSSVSGKDGRQSL